MKKLFLVLILFTICSCDKKTQKNKLLIFTYSSFQSHYGPGSEIVKSFEAKCNCSVELKNVGEAGMLLNRLSIEKQAPDVIIGLDHYSLEEAEAKFKWVSIDLGKINWHEKINVKTNQKFIPFNWAPLTFLYRKKQVKPVDEINKLSKYNKKLILQDPSTSSPGFHFFNWLYEMSDEQVSFTDRFKKLKPAIYRISPSWTASYGLFEKGKAPIVFTYLTSLVYHWKDKKDTSVAAMSFKGQHPVQVEYMAIPKNSEQPSLAKKFVNHMLSKQSQKVIMNKNFMLPVVSGVTDNTLYNKLPKLNVSPIGHVKKSSLSRKQKIKHWMQVLGE